MAALALRYTLGFLWLTCRADNHSVHQPAVTPADPTLPLPPPSAVRRHPAITSTSEPTCPREMSEMCFVLENLIQNAVKLVSLDKKLSHSRREGVVRGLAEQSLVQPGPVSLSNVQKSAKRRASAGNSIAEFCHPDERLLDRPGH